MTATHILNSISSPAPARYLSFELSANQQKIATSPGCAQKPRVVSIARSGRRRRAKESIGESLTATASFSVFRGQ
jgi:hypothetical protein